MFNGDSFSFYNQPTNENVDLNNLNAQRLDITSSGTPEKQQPLLATQMQPLLQPQFQPTSYQQPPIQPPTFHPPPFQPSQCQSPTYHEPMYHQQNCPQSNFQQPSYHQLSYSQPLYSRPTFCPQSFRPPTYQTPIFVQSMNQPQTFHPPRICHPSYQPPLSRSIHPANFQPTFYPPLQSNYRSPFPPIPICDPRVSSTSHLLNAFDQHFIRSRTSNTIEDERNRMIAANLWIKKVRTSELENSKN